MTGYGLGLEYEYINQYKKLFRTVDFFFTSSMLVVVVGIKSINLFFFWMMFDRL